jgi:xanthine dehydrogenase accessory factor
MIGRGPLVELVEAEGAAARVLITRTWGSTPREAGAFLVVAPSGGFRGTIGGGSLEWELTLEALAALRRADHAPRDFARALGPDLGQCCGGRVMGRIEFFTRADLPSLRGALPNEGAAGLETEPLTPLLLFGAGHVGRALALAIAGLPFSTRWIDTRADMFPAAAPGHIEMIHAERPAGEIDAAPEGCFAVIMTHSHALDFDIVAAALASPRPAFVGLIGSETKRARFLSRLASCGLTERERAGLVCPIGVPGIQGKAPAVIAAATAAQLLIERERLRARLSPAPPRETPSPPRHARGEDAPDRRSRARRRSNASGLES